MSTLFGSPALDFMYMSASAPEAPPLSVTTIGCAVSLFFWIAACIIRAIWSEAPPAPAATTISTGLVGSQLAITGALASTADSAAAALMIFRTRFLPYVFVYPGNSGVILMRHCAALWRRVQASLEPGAYDFRMRLQIVSAVYLPLKLAVYLPLKLGVRLLRKASIP